MISVITPVWNRSDLTAQFLLGNHMHYADDTGVQWIIIDNGSTDGTDNILEHWQGNIGDRLIVLRNETNLGFSVACNQGAGRAGGDIFLFLNNDVVIKGDYLSPLEKALDHNPNSLAGPQLLNSDTGWNVFGDKLISYLAGWCLAMTMATFYILDGFDERFSPAYYEDLDLCYNALQEGHELQQVWVPLQHIGEQSGGQLKEKQQITEANRVKFAEKWGLEL